MQLTQFSMQLTHGVTRDGWQSHQGRGGGCSTPSTPSTLLKRKDVTPRYTAKTLLEFFGSVWRPLRIWHFNDILPAPRNVAPHSARALLYNVTTLQCKRLGQRRADGRRTLVDEMAIQNFTASDSQQEPPQPEPQPVLSIIALVLAVVALLLVGLGLISLMRLNKVFKQLKDQHASSPP